MAVSRLTSDCSVLIIGAGATGLLIAQGLKKAGITAKIFERYPEQKYVERSGQWTMALHWSVPHIEACLPSQSFAQLKSAETNPFEEQDPDVAGHIPVVNGRTGKLLAEVPMPSPRRIVRGKLRDLFRQDIEVNFGQALTDLHVGPDGVTAIFNNGETTAKGTMLIGADGVADIRNPDAPDTWVFQFTLSIWTDEDPPASEEERRHLFRAYLSTYCEPYKSVAAWLSDDTQISGEKVSNGLNEEIIRAQGLNNALEDARLYVDAITRVVHGGQDLESNIKAYDDSAYTRGSMDIKLSNEQMYAYHHWDVVMNGPLMRGGYNKQR
ncbi:hypothetical protein AbraIFM66950_009354 [Aspergillus brasiliensis]|nr:hypothetical protein AbraIFM66950_009354 [Aspergillus brasiliensis]